MTSDSDIVVLLGVFMSGSGVPPASHCFFLAVSNRFGLTLDSPYSVGGLASSGVRLITMVEMICLPDQRHFGFRIAGGRVLILPVNSTSAE